MTVAPIRVLIVEDHLIARVGLTTIVEAQADLTVVGEADQARDALAAFEQLRPDVTLMDIRMPGGVDGVAAMTAIRGRAPDARIIAISTYAGDADIRRALDAGARAFLTKDVLDRELIDTIRLVHQGQTYLPAAVSAVLAGRPTGPDLSAREREVLTLIVRGLGNKQIAWDLGITEYTTKNHVKNILAKLGVADRTQAATAAIRRGIIQDS